MIINHSGQFKQRATLRGLRHLALPFGSDNMLISGSGTARLRPKSLGGTSDMSVTVRRN